MCMYPLALQVAIRILLFQVIVGIDYHIDKQWCATLESTAANIFNVVGHGFFQGAAHIIGETDVHTAKQLYARRCGCNDRTPVWGIGC